MQKPFGFLPDSEPNRDALLDGGRAGFARVRAGVDARTIVVIFARGSASTESTGENTMLMDRWIGMDPWKAMDRMFNEAAAGSPRPRTGPRVSFRELDGAYELRAPLPGVAREDVEITVDAELVTIKATRVPKVPEGFVPRRRERGDLDFERSYRLPQPIDAGRVEARLENGVLVATLPPKVREQPRTIAVKAA